MRPCLLQSVPFVFMLCRLVCRDGKVAEGLASGPEPTEEVAPTDQWPHSHLG
jgi:hypothetical protein